MKLIVRFLVVASLLLCPTLVIAADSLSELRKLYQKWNTTYQSLSFDEQQTLLRSLQDYPLFPYAKQLFFKTNIKIITANEMSEFVQKNQDFPYLSTLIQSYLTELTQRQDWVAITSFPRDNAIASTCRYHYALLQQNKHKQAFEPVKSLWLMGKELPSACDPLLDAWSKNGHKIPDLILLRIESAIEQNNLKLASYLVKQLPDNYKKIKTHLAIVLDNPQQLATFSQNITASSLTKAIVLASFPRLAKIDPEAAKTLLPTLVKQQKLTSNEVVKLETSIANRYFNDTVTAAQISWRDAIILKSHDLALIEKRIRLAISKNNYDDIAYWLAQLNEKEQLKEEWQYWQARVLLNKDNNDTNAKNILTALSKNRGFYGMVSAQTLGQNYKLNNQSQPISKSELTALKNKYDNLTVIKRINELRYWGMLTESSREWRYYLNNIKDDKNANIRFLELTKYADKQGWGELSVQATISGKFWDNWTQRLPVMYKNIYNNALKNKSISLSYALAITRQESALDPTVQSPAGAKGLMQLMPETAKETAKKLTYLSYYSANQLFDPETNIELGTYYLNSVYEKNANNRILAAAAYNAGPNRVKRWLVDTSGTLDAIAFIESIPFTETRNYIKNVLVYDYVYQVILNNKAAGILSQNELKQQY